MKRQGDEYEKEKGHVQHMYNNLKKEKDLDINIVAKQLQINTKKGR